VKTWWDCIRRDVDSTGLSCEDKDQWSLRIKGEAG